MKAGKKLVGALSYFGSSITQAAASPQTPANLKEETFNLREPITSSKGYIAKEENKQESEGMLLDITSSTRVERTPEQNDDQDQLPEDNHLQS